MAKRTISVSITKPWTRRRTRQRAQLNSATLSYLCVFCCGTPRYDERLVRGHGHRRIYLHVYRLYYARTHTHSHTRVCTHMPISLKLSKVSLAVAFIILTEKCSHTARRVVLKHQFEWVYMCISVYVCIRCTFNSWTRAPHLVCGVRSHISSYAALATERA